MLPRFGNVASRTCLMALEPLLGDPPKPAFTPHWEGEARLWHSESASTTELPREIREVFKRTGHVRVRSRWAWGIFVATTIEPSPGAGHPFAYLVQEQVDELGYEDTKRMVIEVDPATELVLILLKSEDRTSTVRVRTVLPASKEPARHGQLPSQNLLPTVERHIGQPCPPARDGSRSEGQRQKASKLTSGPQTCWPGRMDANQWLQASARS